MSSSIVWFRNDLRLADNPALIAGLGSGRAVVPVYVMDVEKKLGVFDDIAAKIDLLKDIVNSRFSFKKISIEIWNFFSRFFLKF